MSIFMSGISVPGESPGTGFSAKRSKKSSDGGKLNLVSLMDIFTILVFFLMVNTGDVEILQPDERIVLPKSFAQIRPDTAPVVKVNGDAIYFKEVLVANLNKLKNGASANARDKELINGLYASLVTEKNTLDKLIVDFAEEGEPPKHAISVMGDASVPYALLKKVLYTCAQAGFRDVSLAVEYQSRASEDSVSLPVTTTSGASA